MPTVGGSGGSEGIDQSPKEIDPKTKQSVSRDHFPASSSDSSSTPGLDRHKAVKGVKDTTKGGPREEVFLKQFSKKQSGGLRDSFGGFTDIPLLGGDSIRSSVDNYFEFEAGISSPIEKKYTSDLLTRGELEAKEQAFKTAALVMVFLAQDKKGVQEGEKSHTEVFQRMAKATKDVFNELDPNKKDDQKRLNALGFQWQKGFSPVTGGMGRLPTVGVDIRKKLTETQVKTLKNKGVEGLEAGKTLKECGKTDLDIITTFGGKEKVPKDLQSECDETFDSCQPFGTGLFKDVPSEMATDVEVKLTDMSFEQAGLSEQDVTRLFAPKKVPKEYRVGGELSGKIDMNIKLDEKLIGLIKGKGVRTDKQLESSRGQIESDINIAARKNNRLRAKNIAHNNKVKEGLMDMLTFMEDSATSHFDPKRNATALKTASVQVYSTIGQFYHDHILDGKGDAKLRKAFIANGLCTDRTLEMIKEFDKSGRESPLLAEVKNSDITKALSEAVLSAGDDNALRSNLEVLFYNRLAEVNQEQNLGLNDSELKGMAKELVQEYGEGLKDFKTNLALSNPRGREKIAFGTGEEWRTLLAKLARGSEGKNESVMNMINGSDDQLAEEIVRDCNEVVDKHFADPETVAGLRSGPPPKTLVRGGSGLDSSLVNLLKNPLKLIQQQAAESGGGYPGVSVVLDQILDAGMVEALKGKVIRNDKGALVKWDEAEGKTLKELGVSSDKAIELLILEAFGNDIARVSNDLKADYTIRLDQKLDDEIIAAFSEFDALIDADENEIILEKGKTLSQLGVSAKDIIKLCGGSMAKVPKQLREQKIDVSKGITFEMYNKLSSEHTGKFHIPLTAKQKLLYGLTDKETKGDGLDVLSSGISEELGQIDVPYNKAVRGQMIRFADFANQDSVKKIMADYSIRTICSISGTTLDGVVGAISCMKKEEVEGLLKAILDHANSLPDLVTASDIANPDADGNTLTDQEIHDKAIKENRRIMRDGGHSGLEASNGDYGEKAKHFLSCFGTLMQGGRYHTVGEVIGGLFIAARGKLASTEENRNIDKTRDLFTKLMVDFAENPEHYVPIQDGLAPSIKSEWVKEAGPELLSAEKARQKEERQSMLKGTRRY